MLWRILGWLQKFNFSLVKYKNYSNQRKIFHKPPLTALKIIKNKNLLSNHNTTNNTHKNKIFFKYSYTHTHTRMYMKDVNKIKNNQKKSYFLQQNNKKFGKKKSSDDKKKKNLIFWNFNFVHKSLWSIQRKMLLLQHLLLCSCVLTYISITVTVVVHASFKLHFRHGMCRMSLYCCHSTTPPFPGNISVPKWMAKKTQQHERMKQLVHSYWPK